MAEWTGGGFLLQELMPTRLLGGVLPVIDEAEQAQVRLSFFTGSELIYFIGNGSSECTLFVEWSVAVPLLAQLEVTIAQLNLARETAARPSRLRPQKVVSVTVKEGQSRLLRCAFVPDAVAVVAPADNQLELRMSDDVAQTMVLELLDALARIAAGLPLIT
jgi:hypothetical protein